MNKSIFFLSKPMFFKSRFGMSHAFTLVEVTIALAIVSLVCVVILGLLPVGLTSLKNSIDTTASTQIISKITDEVRQLDFATLTNQDKTGAVAANTTYIRWFDDQGNESMTQQPSSIYLVQYIVTPTSLLPNTSGTPTKNLAYVQITIQSPQAGSLSGTATQATANTKVYTIYVANQ